jgi:ABC-type lipoprotein release transport system permease subunit
VNLIATSKGTESLALLDPWTLVHFSIGLAAGLVGLSAGVAVGAAVAYELAERPFEHTKLGQNAFNVSQPESTANQVVDVFAFAAGHAAGAAWNRTE